MLKAPELELEELDQMIVELAIRFYLKLSETRLYES